MSNPHPSDHTTGPPPRVRALGREVRARRETLGLRQAELAELAGCSARFVHTLEVGKDTLRLDKILDVLEVLGFDLQLVPGKGQVTPPAAHQSTGDRGP